MGDPLVSTKLRVPQTRSNLVARPRLIERLEREAGRRLTLVCAPAGFGKTTLLSEWATSRASGERMVAWLSLDHGDNDPGRFLSYLKAALHTARAESAVDAVAPQGSAEPQLEAVATGLVNEFAALGRELILVLDDYHAIDAEPLHRVVTFLLDRVPSNAHLIISSRVDPPLPLSRLRGRGQMGELRAGELSFTPEESVAFLHEVMGLEVPAREVAALEERTEGWAAGLQLAALSMRDRGDVSGFVASFSGSHRNVLDYLAEEVLERQPLRVRSFLLETSVLDRLTAPLCDTITGRCDGQAMLERLERDNLFVVALDDDRRWYRYHHLFADFLRDRIQRESPGRVGELHRRASDWYEQCGWPSEAVGHALAAQDHDWAVRLVERHIGLMLGRGEGATVDGWLAALPAALVRSRARLCLARAHRAMIRGRLDAAESLLADAERALGATGDDGTEEPGAAAASQAGWAASALANVPAGLALVRAELARLRGDTDRAAEFAWQALGRLSTEERSLRAIANWTLARAWLTRGELDEAERALTEIVAEWLAAGEYYLALVARGDLGRVQRGQGRLRSALRTYQQGLELHRQAGRPSLPALGIAHVGVAQLLYERNELDAALRDVTDGIARCRQLASAQPLAAGLVTLAWIRQARDDPAGALEVLGEAERIGPSPEVVHMFNPVAMQRARLLLAQGAVAEATRWAADSTLGLEDHPGYLGEHEHLALARLLLARGKNEEALRRLARLREEAETGGRVGSAIEILTLQALALQARGETVRAASTLVRALSLAEPEGYVRTFVDEGPAMRELLSRVLDAQQRGRVNSAETVPAYYLRKLLAAMEREAVGAPPPTTALPERLSERELEVLTLIAAGRANREIAGELFVAQSTVKTHVKSIYRKLDARSRTQALARARELDLI